MNESPILQYIDELPAFKYIMSMFVSSCQQFQSPSNAHYMTLDVLQLRQSYSKVLSHCNNSNDAFPYQVDLFSKNYRNTVVSSTDFITFSIAS